MSLPITAHFGLAEFACRDGTPYPSIWIAERLRPLCEVLEVVRADLAAPVVIVSGYRSPAHNARIKGARASQHVEGRAVDVRVVGIQAAVVHARVLALYQAGRLPRLGGLGEYPGWVHLDVRPGARLARWSGSRTGDG